MRKRASLCLIVFLTAIASFLAIPAWAQLEVPQVTPTLKVGNMTLHLTEQAQRDIQADVDALYRSPKYFFLKLERVDMYMPIIEPILAEYGIPDEIKYLVIQESALISDAVSSSNAVGFWQFKETSATELGMRVDRQVDDRMNIVAATTGACKYLLRSNATFDNWLYSLQSYQMGLGGASRSLDKRFYGAREMKIDGDTYWYVKKFLSHIVAFQGAIGQQPRNLMLYQYKNGANKGLNDIAEEFGTDQEQLVEYNKWLKTSRVPDDREYVVIIPVELEEAPNLLAESAATGKQKKNKGQSLEDKIFGEKQKQPEVPAGVRDKLAVAQVNGLKAAVARPGDNARDLATVGGISVADFLKYNEISPGDVLKAGQVYYFKKKKKKASVYRHVAADGETLWDISQKYGVRMSKLLQKNRMKSREQIKAGQVVWLRHIRPSNEPVTYEAVPKKTDEAKVVLPASVPNQQQQKQAQVNKPAPQQKKPEVLQAAVPVVEKKEKPAQVQAVAERAKEPEAVKEQIAQQREERVLAPIPVQKETSMQQEDESVKVLTIEYEDASAQPEKNSYTKMAAVDTPTVKPAPTAPARPQSAPKQQEAAQTKAENHLYPGASEGQRNVYLQNQEKAGSLQQLPKKTADPDSFAAVGQVKFIGEDDAPLKPAPKTVPVNSQGSQLQVEPETGQSAQQLQPQPAVVPVPAAVQDTVHIVLAGETLYSISKKRGLSVQELRDRNGMGADAVLSIGQTLRLVALKQVNNTSAAQNGLALATPKPDNTVAASLEDDRYLYHSVVEGETMYRVARKYNVTIKDIMEWNKRDDFNIRPGEMLVVGKK